MGFIENVNNLLPLLEGFSTNLEESCKKVLQDNAKEIALDSQITSALAQEILQSEGYADFLTQLREVLSHKNTIAAAVSEESLQKLLKAHIVEMLNEAQAKATIVEAIDNTYHIEQTIQDYLATNAQNLVNNRNLEQEFLVKIKDEIKPFAQDIFSDLLALKLRAQESLAHIAIIEQIAQLGGLPDIDTLHFNDGVDY